VGTARAATVSVQLIDVEPTLTYVADPGEANDVTIRYGPSFVTEIVDEGATITVGPGCSSIAPDTARCSGSLAIDADLGDGNDHLVVDSDFDFETGIFRGGEGNDKISASGGPFSFARLFGGPGNDVLKGYDGADVIDGGLDADVLSGGSSVECTTAGICLQPRDTLTYATRTGNVSVDADGVADDGEVLEGDMVRANFENVIGGRGDDFISGSPAKGFLEGRPFLQGTNLQGRGGNDILRGSRALDVLYGGGGNDTVRGRRGSDFLRGQGGNDRLFGGRGVDRLLAGDGDDHLFARDGRREFVNGGDGFDRARIDAQDHARRIEVKFL
jgi:Ca2+-binding RTX toxin-like protein